jgi:hypothetical protein
MARAALSTREAMVDLVRKLKQEGVPVALCTNDFETCMSGKCADINPPLHYKL